MRARRVVLSGFRLERHPLGPRVYLLGLRWHDWHLGLLILAALAAGALLGLVGDGYPTLLAAAAGTWLVAKDWRDLGRSRRDTAAWRLGLHRPPLPLRRFSRAEPMPLLAAVTVAAFAIVNLLSALTPNIHWRGRLLLRIEPIAELHIFHALAIPASLALLLSAYYLYRRRLRALQLAVALLVALAAFNLFKGLDFEEASGDLAAALLLVAGRGAFYVRHDPLARRDALLRIPLIAAGSVLVSLALVALAARAPLGADLRETADSLLWQQGPVALHEEAGRMDVAVGLIGIAALALVGYLLFRPLAAPRSLPDGDLRAAASDLVRRHGKDTLAYFKLRHGKHYLFSDDQRAFLGYRIESGVAVVSGDPVGEPAALPGLLAQLAVFAEIRGLRLAALGVSERLRPLFEQLGLRALYMGDEAIVETGSFGLEGRPIRKVRQSVTRLEKAGFRATLSPLGNLDQPTLHELDQISCQWRRGSDERGFSMALDALRRDEHADTPILLARDRAGTVQGFLHFVPSYGRAAMSLSMMRRQPDTPNGLTEFMIANAVSRLGEQGIEEVSLNFAAFARYLRSPNTLLERLAGQVARRADTIFQIERLYRFNAKFFPRWEPRYAMYERLAALPRVALASLWLEGQLPKPTLRPPRRHAAED